MKATTTILSTLLLTTLVACDDSEKGGESNNASNGADSEQSDGGGDNNAGDTEVQADVDWAGSWTIHIDYEVECEYFGQTQTESFSGTWPMALQGSNDALEVSLESGWFVLQGSGDNDKLLLSGSFPLDGIWDNASSGSDNDVFFNGEDVASADEVSGTMSGSYVEGGGADCDIIDASFTMER